MINFRIKVGKKPIEKALKQFKRKFSEYELREELVKRKEYTKPTTKRRKQRLEAIRENQREVKLNKELDGLRNS